MSLSPSPETDLWAAVVVQAFSDAEQGDEGARRWLVSCGRDMRQVCALAGSDGEVIANHARHALGAELPAPLPVDRTSLLARLAALQGLAT